MVRATHSKINTVYVAFIVLYFITIEHVYCAPGGSPNALQVNKTLKGETKSLAMVQQGHPGLTPIQSSRQRSVRPNGQLWMAELDDVPTLASNGLEALGTGAVQTGRQMKAKGWEMVDVGTKTSRYGQDLHKYGTITENAGGIAYEAGAIYAPDVSRNAIMKTGATLNASGLITEYVGNKVQYAGKVIRGVGGYAIAAGEGVELAGKGINYATNAIPGWNKSES